MEQGSLNRPFGGVTSSAEPRPTPRSSLQITRNWLGRRPTSSIHPLHRESSLKYSHDLMNSIIHSESNDNINGSIGSTQTYPGLLAPAPIRPRMSGTPAFILTPFSSSEFKSTLMKEFSHTGLSPAPRKVTASGASELQLSWTTGSVSVNQASHPFAATQATALTIDDGAAAAQFAVRVCDEDGILDIQNMSEFFTGTSGLWSSSVDDDEGPLRGGRGCHHREDSVIDLDAAMSFQRSGARRARHVESG